MSILLFSLLVNFNPLPSCEGRQDEFSNRFRHTKFQSTPLMRGET